MKYVEKSIINTLLYSSLFKSPLKVNELYTRLQTNKKISKKEFYESLKILVHAKKIYIKNHYYYLKNITKLFKKKSTIIENNLKKINILNQNLKKILPIPFICAIYLTGSLAVLGSPDKEDFDLLIIAENKRLWIVRFIILIKAQLLGLRRIPKEKNITNKFCFNIFLEKDTQEVIPEKQNLYLSYEIIQAKPLYLSKDYNKDLLDHNPWIKKYLFNAKKGNLNNYHLALEEDYNFLLKPQILQTKSYKSFILDIINYFLYKFQYLYMKPKITNETIKYNQAFFHPNDISKYILETFELAKKQIS